MEIKSSAKKRGSYEQRRRNRLAHVAAYKRSGLTGRAYCERYGLSISTLWYWVGRERHESNDPQGSEQALGSAIKCVGNFGDLLGSSSESLAKLRLSCGSELEIGSGARVDQIEAVFKGARECLR